MKFKREIFEAKTEVYIVYTNEKVNSTRVKYVACRCYRDFSGKFVLLSADEFIPEKEIQVEYPESHDTGASVIKGVAYYEKHTVISSISSHNVGDKICDEWVELPIPEGWIVLDDGTFMYRDYGKMRPNLLFLSDTPEINFKKVKGSEYNLPISELESLLGVYFKTKKGADAFRITTAEKATHVLLKDNWGGAFNRYRGNTIPEEQAIYYRRAASNGGGVGNDYGVFKTHWLNSVSMNDF